MDVLLSNLAIILCGLAVALFATSLISRRSPENAQKFRGLINLLRLAILALAAFYFYKRFVG